MDEGPNFGPYWKRLFVHDDDWRYLTGSPEECEAIKRALSSRPCDGFSNCGGQRFVLADVPPQHPLFGQAIPCSCYVDEANARRLRAVFERMRVPPEMRNLTLDSFREIPSRLRQGKDKAALAAGRMADVEGFRQAGGVVIDGVSKPGLVFYGPVGTGKTGLATAIALSWLMAGRGVAFFNWYGLWEQIQKWYGEPGGGAQIEQRMAELESAALLVLDDFGSLTREHETPDRTEKFGQIVDARAMAHQPMVLTTNLKPESLTGYFADAGRIASRLTKACHFIPVEGADLRPYVEEVTVLDEAGRRHVERRWRV